MATQIDKSATIIYVALGDIRDTCQSALLANTPQERTRFKAMAILALDKLKHAELVGSDARRMRAYALELLSNAVAMATGSDGPYPLSVEMSLELAADIMRDVILGRNFYQSGAYTTCRLEELATRESKGMTLSESERTMRDILVMAFMSWLITANQNERRAIEKLSEWKAAYRFAMGKKP